VMSSPRRCPDASGLGAITALNRLAAIGVARGDHARLLHVGMCESRGTGFVPRHRHPHNPLSRLRRRTLIEVPLQQPLMSSVPSHEINPSTSPCSIPNTATPLPLAERWNIMLLKDSSMRARAIDHRAVALGVDCSCPASRCCANAFRHDT